jgi:hypothetical protein
LLKLSSGVSECKPLDGGGVQSGGGAGGGGGGARQGWAVQVDPMKPMLKAPKSKRLKLRHGRTGIRFRFQCHLAPLQQGGGGADADGAADGGGGEAAAARGVGGRGTHFHFSAQPEPFLILKTSPKLLHTPSIPAIDTLYTTHKHPLFPQ